MFTARLNIEQKKYPLDDQPMWLNDPLNTKFSEQRRKKHDKKSCAEYIDQCSMFWGIKDVDSGDWIGTISAHIDKPNEIADVGILIHHEYSGKGYGTEAWDAVCQFILNTQGVRKIEAGCMANNVAMRKLCVKTNMFYEGERQAHFLTDQGHPVGMSMYGKWRTP